MVDVLIYGAGAIGSFMGYLLSKPRDFSNGSRIDNVALLGRESHIRRIQEAGLQIDLPEGAKTTRFKHCFAGLHEFNASDFHPELVIVCVKTHSLPGVCKELRESDELQGRLKDASFLFLMNGMGNGDVFGELDLPSHRVMEGITSIGVKFPEDGKIELKGRGRTVIEDKIGEGIKDFLRERFQEKGHEIEFAPDFKLHQWNKLFVNSVINPITALTRRENGIILSHHLRSTVQSIVRESVSVALKEGMEVNEEQVLEFVYSVAENTSQNTSSMLQDTLMGKTTEIDSINGYIIRLAEKHKIKVTANETLYGLVKSLEIPVGQLSPRIPSQHQAILK